MKDLTQGSIPRHLLHMALPIAIGMTVQTLYFMVDLYFVGQLGDSALAGVSAAGNANFIILALTQILNVGTAALISHAVGRKDQPAANLLFNQAWGQAILLMLATLICGYLLTDNYLRTLSADATVLSAGTAYLHWFIPGMALQFPLVVLSAAMRGTGIVKPAMMIQLLTVLINIILAPILIAGWGTGYAMGTAGAGLASTISVIVGVILLVRYYLKLEHYVSIVPAMWRPDWQSWKRILSVGFPSGAEFLLMFAYMAVIYWAIAQFGAEAQAGFGVGSRVMQCLLLPAMALAFAAPAIAGQNFGAGLHPRIVETFKWSAIISTVLMLTLSLIAWLSASWLVTPFTDDVQVITFAAHFLSIICWNFVPSCLVFCCSGIFQGIGNTWPALLSSATRIITFAVPAIWLATSDHFVIDQLWYLSVATVIGQALLSLWLLRRQLRKFAVTA